MEQFLQKTDLQYTVVRPPGLQESAIISFCACSKRQLLSHALSEQGDGLSAVKFKVDEKDEEPAQLVPGKRCIARSAINMARPCCCACTDVSWAIAYEDVASFMLDVVEKDRFLRKGVAIGVPQKPKK